jgi:hypothetical protein
MRHYRRVNRKAGEGRATEEEVLNAVRRLARQQRTMRHGVGLFVLPGPIVSDIARAVGRYPEAVRPPLTALVKRGLLRCELFGNARCFVLVDQRLKKTTTPPEQEAAS